MLPLVTELCPGCNKTTNLRGDLKTYSYVCPNCHYLINRVHKERIKKFPESLESTLPEDGQEVLEKNKPQEIVQLEIGDSFHWQGMDYEITGIGYFQEKGKPYNWTEYVLYAREGIKILTCFDNTYNLFDINPLNREDITDNQPNRLSIKYKNTRFKCYNHYSINVLFLKGEFPYDPTHIEKVYEYVHAPYIISVQIFESRKDYVSGEYLSTSEVRKATGKKVARGKQVYGTNYFLKNWNMKQLWVISLLCIVSLFLINSQIAIEKPEKNLFSASYQLSDTGFHNQKIQLVSPTFQISESTTGLEFDLFTPEIRNEYLDFNVVLVNESSNELRYFSEYTEYYSGMDDGEIWAEDGRKKTGHLNGVKKGAYHLELEISGPPSTQGRSLVLQAWENAPAGNTFFFVFLLLLVPGYISSARLIQESHRWTNSDINHNL